MTNLRQGGRTPHGAWRAAGDAALWVGALVGTLSTLSVIAVVVLGVQPLIFRSGSMSPTISTGALAFAKSVPAADLNRGDIVSVRDAKGTRVTHRITKIKMDGRQSSLMLKGDANEIADAAPYVVSSADRVYFDLPKVGYVISWLSGPIGTFGGGLLAGGLLLLVFRPGRSGTARRGNGKTVATGTIAAFVAANLLVAGAATPEPTLAAWTDSATVTTGSFTMATVATPPGGSGAIKCIGNGNNNKDLNLNWVSGGPEYEYVVTVTSQTVPTWSAVAFPVGADNQSVTIIASQLFPPPFDRKFTVTLTTRWRGMEAGTSSTPFTMDDKNQNAAKLSCVK